MNLVSCVSCGVVIDSNRCHAFGEFTEDGYDDNCLWDDYEEKYVKTWECPVCKTRNPSKEEAY